MSIIIAQANGDWHSETNNQPWPDGTIPGVGDDVQLQGKTIAWTALTPIDASTITTLGTAGKITRTMSGTTNYALNCSDGITAGTAKVLDISGTGTGTLTITGDITGGGATNAFGLYTVSNGIIKIIGDVIGSNFVSSYGCFNEGAGDITIIGDLTGGTGTSAYGCRNKQNGTITVTGDVTGGGGQSAAGMWNVATGDVVINGNVTGGPGSGVTAYGIINSSIGTVTINGNVAGGAGVEAFGVQNASTGIVTINNGNILNSTGAVALSGRDFYDINMATSNFYQMADGTKFFPQSAIKDGYRSRYQ